MSARNGDKARFQKNRKRTVLHRSKIRELVKNAAATATVAKATVPKDTVAKDTVAKETPAGAAKA